MREKKIKKKLTGLLSELSANSMYLETIGKSCRDELTFDDKGKIIVEGNERTIARASGSLIALWLEDDAIRDLIINNYVTLSDPNQAERFIRSLRSHLVRIRNHNESILDLRESSNAQEGAPSVQFMVENIPEIRQEAAKIALVVRNLINQISSAADVAADPPIVIYDKELSEELERQIRSIPK